MRELRRPAERSALPYGALSRRQPAEGAAREVVPDRAAAPAARRADAGRRRRRAAADLRARSARRSRSAACTCSARAPTTSSSRALCDRVIVFGRGRVWRELVGDERDEGADHRAVLRGNGSGGRRGRRRERATERRRGTASRPRASARLARRRPGRALRAARRLGRRRRRLRHRCGRTRSPRRRTSRPSSARRRCSSCSRSRCSSPLTAGDYDLSVAATMALSAMIARDPERQPRLADRRSSIAAALGVGAAGRARQRRASSCCSGSTRSSSRSARRRSSPASILWISDSQTISGISTGLSTPSSSSSFLGIPLAFYYGIALGLRHVLRLRVHAARAAAALRRPRPQRRAAERHPGRAAALGRARRLRA